MSDKDTFIKPERDIDMNPVDYFNMHKSFVDCFTGVKTVKVISAATFSISRNGTVDFEVKPDGCLYANKVNKIGLAIGKPYTKFMVLTKARFKNNSMHAMAWIAREFLTQDMPYICVGCDYFKITQQLDVYGNKYEHIIPWKETHISRYDGKEAFQFIPRYDKFVVEPSYISYERTPNGNYNRFQPLSHMPVEEEVTVDHFPAIYGFLHHLFGKEHDQMQQIFVYFQYLYLFPKQRLPIISLVSSDRQTGKTSMLELLRMMFGENVATIFSEDVTKDFNSHFADKNIIVTDETFVEKSVGAEKIKNLSTAKKIRVNTKHVAQYETEFYAKFLFFSNKVYNFMKIEDDEIRFWVRKVPKLHNPDNTIFKRMQAEIPYFLKYLLQMDIYQSKDRFILSAEDIFTPWLADVREETKSELYHHLKEKFDELFSMKKHKDLQVIYVKPGDVHQAFCENNARYTTKWIRTVLRDEFKAVKMARMRYTPIMELMFSIPNAKTGIGTPFEVTREMILKNE